MSGIKQNSFQYHFSYIRGAGIFQTSGIFIDSPGSTPPSNDPAETLPRQVEGWPVKKTRFPLSFEFKHFPRLVFVVSPLKVLLLRQNYASSIIDDSLKFHSSIIIFLIPAENLCFCNFPALFSWSSGVVTGEWVW